MQQTDKENLLSYFASLDRRLSVLEAELLALRDVQKRAAIHQALHYERILSVTRNQQLFRVWDRFYRACVQLYGRLNLGTRYGGRSDLRTANDYTRWVSHEQHEIEMEDHQQIAADWRSKPFVSLIMIVRADVPEADVRDSAKSIFEQCYSSWELCLVYDGTAPEWANAIDNSRTRVIHAPEASPPISEAAAQAKGEWLLIVEPGDRLSTHALHYYVEDLQHLPADILYADEDYIGADGVRREPTFKPDWSPELLMSTQYVGRAILFRRDVFLEHVSCWTGVGSDPIWDILLRIADRKPRTRHIRRILNHRNGDKLKRTLAPESGRDVIEAALQRQALPATVEQSPRRGFFRICYTPHPDARLSIVICSQKVHQVHECLEAIRSTSSIPTEILVVHHQESGNDDGMIRCVEAFAGKVIRYRGRFNFAKMNNLAAANATAPFIVFMNDDVVVHQTGWDGAIVGALSRSEIGIAGAVLEYPDGTIQHAGVVSAMGEAVGHCGRFQVNSELWPWLRLGRDVSAVTGALLGIRRDVFQTLGAFDESFPVNYNDVDLCFRAVQAGLRVLCLDLGRVIHKECQTRTGGTHYHERDALYAKWAALLAHPDEFYSVHLAPTERIALHMIA